jgi:hypothetical protein
MPRPIYPTPAGKLTKENAKVGTFITSDSDDCRGYIVEDLPATRHKPPRQAAPPPRYVECAEPEPAGLSRELQELRARNGAAESGARCAQRDQRGPQEMTVHGTALRMRIELAAMVRKLGLTPAPFTPPPPLAPVEGDWVVAGIASPVTIDREFTKFGPHCWMPFKQDIPLLYRHDRPAGKVLEIKDTDQGLSVCCLVSDAEAKCAQYFSIAATIHSFTLRHQDDRERAHAAVTCATLEEVSIVNDPAHPGAKITQRYRQSAAVEFYDIAIAGVGKCIEIVELLRKINHEQPDRAPANSEPVPNSEDHRPSNRTHGSAFSRDRIEPHRATDFGKLITAMEARSPA